MNERSKSCRLTGSGWAGHQQDAVGLRQQLIELDQLPDLLALTALLAPRAGVLPNVKVELPDLAGFDALLGVQA